MKKSAEPWLFYTAVQKTEKEDILQFRPLFQEFKDNEAREAHLSDVAERAAEISSKMINEVGTAILV